MSAILIIDDDRALCRSLEIQLSSQEHEIKYANNAAEGLKILAEWTPDLIFLDLMLPDRSGLDLLNQIQKNHNVPIVMITAQQDTKATIEAMRAGAFDYIRKPFNLDDVLLVIEKANRAIKEQNRSKVIMAPVTEAPYEIVGVDKKTVEVVKQIGLLSLSRVTVLVEGESGTGKELVARALHEASVPGKPFVAINCSSVVPTLLESELFGHEKGAFTGAETRKIGKLEHADEGTIFFDEIGDMPLDLQSKILRVFQEREFERVGGLENIPFKARVIVATNQNLEVLIKEGKFRQDLYYRLAVSRIVLPPLRERPGDIPLLVRHLIDRIGRKLHRRVKAVETETMRRLQSYHWPGNIRELENVLTRAIALARGDVISPEELEFSLGEDKSSTTSKVTPLKDAEKKHIRKALMATGWNITHTAKMLRISPTTLRKKISDFNLRKD
jgi:two-component system response regulator AtoC